MRQRKMVVGLLMIAAMSIGLVPATGQAAPWACVAVWNPVVAECTAEASTSGGVLYFGTVRVYVDPPGPAGEFKKYENNRPDCYHLSTLHDRDAFGIPGYPGIPAPLGCQRMDGVGPGKVRLVATGPGAWAAVGSRGE